MSELQVADLFCGPGGMSLGFKNFFDVTLAVDWHKDVCNTYRRNLSGVVRQRDVRDISGSQRDFDGIIGIIGGTPCKPFSRLNLRKRPDDYRIHLWKELMRLVEEVKPGFFLMENIPRIFNEVKLALLRKAKELGYITNHAILETSEFGVPQKRKRWIVVGSKKPFTFPAPTTKTPMTVKEAFSKIIVNEGFAQTRPETLERLRNIPVGRWVSITDGKFKSAIRLDPNQPSPTIVNISKVYMVHPTEFRVISESEAAILQDFPENYEFLGNRSVRTQMIADAAPRSFMYAIARQIKTTQYGNDS